MYKRQILYRLNKDGKKITEQQILLETRKYDEKLYDLINDRIDEMNKVNHDMRQHMLVIEKMLENNDNVEVLSLIHIYNTNCWNKTFIATHI